MHCLHRAEISVTAPQKVKLWLGKQMLVRRPNSFFPFKKNKGHNRRNNRQNKNTVRHWEIWWGSLFICQILFPFED